MLQLGAKQKLISHGQQHRAQKQEQQQHQTQQQQKQQQAAEEASEERRSRREDIRISGRQLLVNGKPFHMKGVNWNPVPKGERPPRGLQWQRYVQQDSAMMADAGINVVRTYEPITDRGVLDVLWSHGIRVASTVYSYGGHDPWSVANHVNAVKDHPAILMWVLGNEWNYNFLYKQSLSFGDAVSRVKDAARIVKQHDTSHPVATIYGELPSNHVLQSLPEIDIWGMNVYNELSLGNTFSEWKGRSKLPMFLGEFGADAWDARTNSVNEDAQAQATTALTNDIVSHSSVLNPDNVCAGGFVFEWADEWWKDAHGSASVHDAGGIAPGGGPFPDRTFNEEYWGLVHEDRRPRAAYHAYAAIAPPRAAGLIQAQEQAAADEKSLKRHQWGGSQEVRVEGRQLLVGGKPVHLKGVNWNPVPRGERPPRGLRFREYVDRDAKLMADIGINAVRTYEPITDTYVLDTFHRHGIWVANTVYSWGGSSPHRAAQIVNRVKNHPAILMWVIGNEWNYNMLYFDRLSHEDVYERIRVASRLVKQHDSSHPVTTIYGSLPSQDTIGRLPDIDIWGMNVYSGISLGNIFDKWKGLSNLPMFFGEYGADAYNAHKHAEDEEAQARATTALTEEILAHSSASRPDGTCIGGFVFEWADELWKDLRGSDSVQDVGGIAPGGGPYPDNTFNEEFWGLVHEDRTPRAAYHALGKVTVPAVQEAAAAAAAPTAA